MKAYVLVVSRWTEASGDPIVERWVCAPGGDSIHAAGSSLAAAIARWLDARILRRATAMDSDLPRIGEVSVQPLDDAQGEFDGLPHVVTFADGEDAYVLLGEDGEAKSEVVSAIGDLGQVAGEPPPGKR